MKRVDANTLAQAIANIVSAPGYGNRAQRIGEPMQARDGIAGAVELLTVKFRAVIQDKKGA
ncbi:hypothetical protein [Methylomicrobium agile]|uniref:hypothetical protein n=1 Tax=Methylomicrobium agile TaxID=39774 RepID=UPI0002623F57|nr:hypothetical protein [Methylomicrobium agile]